MHTYAYTLAVSIALLALAGRSSHSAVSELLVDYAFRPPVDGSISAIAVQEDGRIVIGGDRRGGTADHRPFVERLQADGTPDPSFDPGTGPANSTDCHYDSVVSLVATENAIYMGGRFTGFNGVNRSCIVRLDRDGALDETFDPPKLEFEDYSQGCIGPYVSSIAVQPDGKVLIAGDFAIGNRDGGTQIVRLNADGSLDESYQFSSIVLPSWSRGNGLGQFTLNSIALQADAKLIVAGRFSVVDGVSRHSIVRFNMDGSIDREFAPEVSYSDGQPGYVRSLLVQPDGRILLGGNFQRVNGWVRHSVARLKPDGSLDTGFQAGVASDANILGLALQADGKVLALGRGNWNGVPSSDLFRFHAGLKSRAIQFVSTSQLLCEEGKTVRVPVERIDESNDTATVDYATIPGSASAHEDYSPRVGTLRFEPGVSVQYIDVDIREDHLAEGEETLLVILKNPTGNSILWQALVELKIWDDDRPGSVDLSFKPSRGATLGGNEIATGGITELVAQPNGRIWAWGAWLKGTPFACVLDRDGSLIADFPSGFEPEFPPVRAIGAQSDGRMIVLAFGDTLVRLDEDGSMDESYGECCYGSFDPYSRFSGIVQPDDKVILPTSPIVRLDATGREDPSFRGPAFRASNFTLNAVTLQRDGSLLVGGDFAVLSNIPRSGIARVRSNGELDRTFDPSLVANTNADALFLARDFVGEFLGRAVVNSVLSQEDGKVIVAGRFSIPNHPRHNNLARLNPDGSLDPVFLRDDVPPFETSVSTLLQRDGGIIVASTTITSSDLASGPLESRLTRLNPDGSRDSGFNVGTQPNGIIRGMTWQTDGRLLIWGSFTEINGVPGFHVARLNVQKPFTLGLPVRAAGNEVVMTLSGEPGHAYVLQASSDLRTWSSVQTNTSAGVALEFRDVQGAFNAQRFYRAELAAP
jgi:uncharacterized delta-60 repeat protein